MSLRPINRIKHVVDIQGALPSATVVANKIINTKDAPVLANVSEVETGCTINGIFLNIQVYATSATSLANCYFIMYKNPGNNITAPQPNTVGSDDNKRFVIHQEMVMLEKNTTGIPRTMFKGVIAIPRGMRRCAPNDTWYINLFTPGVTADFCIQTIYKEFR